MIVLAESNFVLELALRQEEFDHADRIVRLAEEQRLRLVIPAWSFAEPYQTLVRRGGERRELRRRLQGDLKLLSRSKAFAELGAKAEEIALTLEASIEIERKALEQTIERLLKSCVVPAMSDEVVKSGQVAQLGYKLEPQDALVFASMDLTLRSLGSEPKVFINKNSKDFGTPLIEGRLASSNCRLITSFADGRQYVENELNKHLGGH